MTTKHTIRLTYFDFHGGRGETARLALSIGGVEFEDRRIAYQDWPQVKAEMPFGGVPLLEVDGRRVTQSNGINRFVGKLAGLYPEDPWQAALCDEAMDVVEDATHPFAATLFMPEDEKKAAREKLADGRLKFFLTRVDATLGEHGGEYFADGRLTVADLKVFLWTRHLRSGNIDYMPADLPDRHGPRLVEHFQRVQAHPGVKAYYERVKG
jgi:glutathione S-transferase